MAMSPAGARASARCFARGPAAAIALVACCSGSPARAQSADVRINDFRFEPIELTILPGTTVTWTNADEVPHTVTSANKIFRSKPLDTGDRFTFTFASPGHYSYFCTLHPRMTGKIIVRAP